MKILEYIQSDCFRYIGCCDYISILRLYRYSSTFRWQVAFRMCKGDGLVKFLGCILWKFNLSKNRIQISKETSIGYGLYIGHGGPVIINPTATIGNNCNLSQFCTIGSNDENAATIGDNVYIGPNTCIVENVVIGDNVTIGAGSVVTKSIPENATAAGNYAKVLNYNKPGRYIKSRWPMEKNRMGSCNEKSKL